MQKIRSGLFIGDIWDAASPESYRRNGIDTVVKLSYEDPEDGYSVGVEVRDFEMMDGPRNSYDDLESAVEVAVESVREGRQVFVHCSAGASRSVGVCAAASALLDDTRFVDGLEKVREARSVGIHDAVRENAERAVERLR
jgi:protein-tyrosine phosphatase